MNLPKIAHPTFELTLPSTKQQIRYRPFLVKEEKILLIAQASDNPVDIFNAITQVVANCIVTEGVDVNKFTSFDLEYFFMRLRAKSVSNVVELTYRDNEDGQMYSFEVDLEQVEVKMPDVSVANTVDIQDGYKLRLKYPLSSVAQTVSQATTEADVLYAVARQCIDVLFKDSEVYNFSDYSEQEVDEFMADLPVQCFQQIKEFAISTPRLFHRLAYTNKNGNERIIELTSLNDFFTLR